MLVHYHQLKSSKNPYQQPLYVPPPAQNQNYTHNQTGPQIPPQFDPILIGYTELFPRWINRSLVFPRSLIHWWRSHITSNIMLYVSTMMDRQGIPLRTARSSSTGYKSWLIKTYSHLQILWMRWTTPHHGSTTSPLTQVEAHKKQQIDPKRLHLMKNLKEKTQRTVMLVLKSMMTSTYGLGKVYSWGIKQGSSSSMLSIILLFYSIL